MAVLMYVTMLSDFALSNFHINSERVIYTNITTENIFL